MYASLICHPPLGQTTSIAPDKDSVRFTVLIESSAGSEKSWEVALWHNFDDSHQWNSLSLQSCAEPSVAIVSALNSNARRQYFSIDLPGRPKNSNVLSYTVTFRASKDEPWKWANEHFSTSDGHLVYQSSEPCKDDLNHYIEALPPFIKADKEHSDTPETLLWSLSSPVKAAKGKTPGLSHEKLGKPTSFSRYFAVTRLWSPWLAPRQGKSTFAPDKEAILAAFERTDGSHLVVLAVSGIDDVLTLLKHDNNGSIVLSAQNDREKDGIARILVAVGKTMESAVAATMYHARKLVTQYQQATGEMGAEAEAKDDGVKAEWLENWYDGLSYCTWNGLGPGLTEQKIFDALQSLADNGIHISNLIIDDNWQSLFEDAWVEFEANKTGFPRGLKATITDIRSKYKGLRHVAVWHAIYGYWGGIAPNGKIAKEYKTVAVLKKDGVAGGETTVVSHEDVNRFYSDFYKFLSSAGIDSVKTDAQFFLDELKDADDRHNLITAYQDAWSVNQLRYFAAKAISCMSMVPQLMFHSQLPHNKPKILLRNSDDFFPDVPASHPWHIFCNAHNAVFTQHLNILPDWDMFQTSHDYASFHAAARCVSGGPIYITDVPGKHDASLIAAMTGTTPRGDTVILRPHTVGKTTNAYNNYDDAVLLKVATYVGAAKTGSSILGIFNCATRALAELVALDAFPGAEKGKYIIRAHTSGHVTGPTCAATPDAFVYLELPVRGWEILTAYPLHDFKLKRGGHVAGPPDISVANLGALGKMSGAAAVVGSSFALDESGKLRVWTALKILGIWGIYISDLPARSIDDDFFVLIFGRPVPRHCVRVSDAAPNVLEVDTARAWKETGLVAQWSNEVNMEIIIR